jgi:CcmD family protein
MVNQYLFLAFSALGAIFFVYVCSLSWRQAHLRKELEELKSNRARKEEQMNKV